MHNGHTQNIKALCLNFDRKVNLQHNKLSDIIHTYEPTIMGITETGLWTHEEEHIRNRFYGYTTIFSGLKKKKEENNHNRRKGCMLLIKKELAAYKMKETTLKGWMIAVELLLDSGL